MRNSFCLWVVASLALICRAEATLPLLPSGGEIVPGPATVAGDRVSVRGQPGFTGEVITRLDAGAEVNVLELVERERPAAGEPAHWARIQMPAGTPVYVFAQFVDGATKTVQPARLNVRAGPGERFSIVGSMTRGDRIEELQTEGNWIKIQAPPTAYAFIAAELLVQTPPAPPIVATPVQPPPPTPIVTPPPTIPDSILIVDIPPTIEEPKAVTIVEVTPQAGLLVPVPTVPEPTPAPPEFSLAPPVVTFDPSTPREVIREGFVRATVSIQAPTEWFLADSRYRRQIAYLQPTTKEPRLYDFWEKKVRVTGTESVDRRWPTTPILTIQSIELVRE